MNFPTRVGNFEASIVCWREATRLVHCPANRQRQTAFGA